MPILILPHSQLISIPTLHTQYPFPYYSIPIAILFYVHTKSTYYLLLINMVDVYIYPLCISHAHLFHIPIPILFFFLNIFDETLAAKYMQHNSPHSLARQTHTISRGTSMGLARNTEYIYISDHWGVVLIIQQSTSLHLCVSVSELSIHRLLPRVWCFVTQGYTNMKKICLSLQVNVF